MSTRTRNGQRARFAIDNDVMRLARVCKSLPFDIPDVLECWRAPPFVISLSRHLASRSVRRCTMRRFDGEAHHLGFLTRDYKLTFTSR